MKTAALSFFGRRRREKDFQDNSLPVSSGEVTGVSETAMKGDP